MTQIVNKKGEYVINALTIAIKRVLLDAIELYISNPDASIRNIVHYVKSYNYNNRLIVIGYIGLRKFWLEVIVSFIETERFSGFPVVEVYVTHRKYKSKSIEKISLNALIELANEITKSVEGILSSGTVLSLKDIVSAIATAIPTNKLKESYQQTSTFKLKSESKIEPRPKRKAISSQLTQQTKTHRLYIDQFISGKRIINPSQISINRLIEDIFTVDLTIDSNLIEQFIEQYGIGDILPFYVYDIEDRGIKTLISNTKETMGITDSDIKTINETDDIVLTLPLNREQPIIAISQGIAITNRIITEDDLIDDSKLPLPIGFIKIIRKDLTKMGIKGAPSKNTGEPAETGIWLERSGGKVRQYRYGYYITLGDYLCDTANTIITIAPYVVTEQQNQQNRSNLYIHIATDTFIYNFIRLSKTTNVNAYLKTVGIDEEILKGLIAGLTCLSI